MFFLFLFPQFWEVTFSAWLSDEELITLFVTKRVISLW